ncbi:hypothetical protein SAMN06295974_0906 [Plantibacter flavus]|uniref:Uncharacterized protein n=1 Tax=Plantibacter flavus TaxID=150123 RepID=A0A3N2C2D0_9MICO|nr:hypothetical protein [Plantibacter flavus]ROR81662.1 hypothetical protein EDD42_1732 [Plantibacter flavus]SMG15341.1 hypothetical protein SAMN06295974_0906 [Plantibacter flavus]
MTDQPNVPISREEIEAKYNTNTPRERYSNPYLRTMGLTAAILGAIGLLVTAATFSSYSGAAGGLTSIVAGLTIAVFWLLGGAVVHAVRSLHQAPRTQRATEQPD